MEKGGGGRGGKGRDIRGRKRRGFLSLAVSFNHRRQRERKGKERGFKKKERGAQ